MYEKSKFKLKIKWDKPSDKNTYTHIISFGFQIFNFPLNCSVFICKEKNDANKKKIMNIKRLETESWESIWLRRNKKWQKEFFIEEWKHEQEKRKKMFVFHFAWVNNSLHIELCKQQLAKSSRERERAALDFTSSS